MTPRDLFGAIALVLTLGCASAETPVLGECSDDMGVDRCGEDALRRMREHFGLPTIEELAAQGAEVRRAFFVDGYGNDVAVVTFERPSGADPRVVVTVRRDRLESDARVVEMTAALPSRTWQNAIERTRYFDRDFVPLPPLNPDERKICFHSWLVVMEAANPNADRPLRRKAQDSCDEGLAVSAAFIMANHAVELLPHCGALDLDQYRNSVTLLATCATLEGDRIAAAEALNQYQKLEFVYRAPSRSDLALLVHDRAELRWPDEPASNGITEAVDFWTGHMLHQIVVVTSFVGQGSDRVRMTGRIYARDSEGDTPPWRPVEQLWVRENGFDFRLREMQIGEPTDRP